MPSFDLFAGLPDQPVIVIALSGGADSMLLAEWLAEWYPAEQLAVAHFDHGLREDSAADADFCRAWAEEKHIRFFGERWQTPLASEEKAREARRAFLFRIRDELQADAIALGSHADDQAETVFFRFLRGSGPAGLGGMRRFDRTTRLFRPLLGMSKAEILAALAARQVPFREDSTNTDLRYARNFLRHAVFPLLDERFPNFRQRLCAQAEVFRQTARFLRGSARDFLKQYPPHTATSIRTIDRTAFRALPAAIRAEVFRQLTTPRVPDAATTRRLVAFAVGARSGKRMHLFGITISVYTDTIVITPHEA